MKRIRVRQHVNPDAPFYEDMAVARLALDGRPVELELGCAEAQFLFERARVEPAAATSASRSARSWSTSSTGRAAVEGLPVEAVFCHANLHLGGMFAAGAVDRSTSTSPDPWFKRPAPRAPYDRPRAGARDRRACCARAVTSWSRAMCGRSRSTRWRCSTGSRRPSTTGPAPGHSGAATIPSASARGARATAWPTGCRYGACFYRRR